MPIGYNYHNEPAMLFLFIGSLNTKWQPKRSHVLQCRPTSNNSAVHIFVILDIRHFFQSLKQRHIWSESMKRSGQTARNLRIYRPIRRSAGYAYTCGKYTANRAIWSPTLHEQSTQSCSNDV